MTLTPPPPHTHTQDTGWAGLYLADGLDKLQRRVVERQVGPGQPGKLRRQLLAVATVTGQLLLDLLGQPGHRHKDTRLTATDRHR